MIIILTLRNNNYDFLQVQHVYLRLVTIAEIPFPICVVDMFRNHFYYHFQRRIT